MKMRLLSALVVAGCFSQMAVADKLTTGVLTNQTTATATVTINQPVTLDNTIIPVTGLKAGKQSGIIYIAHGKLSIKEFGAKARLAVMFDSLSTFANGHEGDADYKLTYRPLLSSNIDTDSFQNSDGGYLVAKEADSEFDYDVIADGENLPNAGSYVISVTGAVYNP